MEKYNLMESVPVSIKNYLQDGLRGNIPDTPKPGDKIFENSYNFLIGTNQIALQAAKLKAEALGYTASILSEALSGEARLKAIEVVKWASEYKGPRPACLLMGGETTVTIKGNGIGGRNQEFVLAALVALKNNSDVPVILSAGTDGTDGPTPAAGAVIDESTMDATIDPKPYLSNNDSYHFFQQAGGHIITGPTQTNVMDVVVVLIG
jgi:hydroxypyruvate reductase